MTTPRLLARGWAMIATAVLVAACSASKSSDPTSTASQSTTTATSAPSETSATSTAPSSVAPSSVATTDGPPTDATAAITAAFTTFFDGVDPDTDGKIAVLEHGDELRQMIVDAAADPQFQQLTTTVNSVTMLNDTDCATAGEVSPCASVAHDMFVGGLPAMVGLQSHAVEIDGVWKVSAKSWCAIVEIGGATCPTLPAG